jgi:hypothetical protein
MEIQTFILDNKTDKNRGLKLVFDTGAYITTIDRSTLLRAGYDYKTGKSATLIMANGTKVEANEVVLKGMYLGDTLENSTALGAVLVYAIDAPNADTPGVLGLNVIREFETKIKFDKQATIELEPNFDTTRLIAHENFIKGVSRFGEWS